MLRVRRGAAVVGAMGIALAGCASSSAPSWMPSWMTITPPAPPLQPLQFESTPAGADVSTLQGQTCKTPCSLALPLTNQTVTFALNGYVSQTVPVSVLNSTAFTPNPIEVTLQTVPKPGKPKPKLPKTAAGTETATRSSTPATSTAAPANSPDQDSAFPPPPATPSLVESRFPPPPPQSPPTR
jgi:hypothetical protein